MPSNNNPHMTDKDLREEKYKASAEAVSKIVSNGSQLKIHHNEGVEYYCFKEDQLRDLLNENADWWIDKLKQIRIQDLQDRIGEVRGMKEIPVVIPHGSPYLSGYNQAIEDILASLEKDLELLLTK